MNETRTDQAGKTWNINAMSTQHIINAIYYIRRNYEKWCMEVESFDGEGSYELEEKERQYQALHNELTLRVAEKLLKEWKIDDLPF